MFKAGFKFSSIFLMQSSDILDNFYCAENETDLLETGENLKLFSDEELERSQSKIFEISLGNIGLWQKIWCIILSIFQCISTLHLFSFLFHVCKF